MVPQIVSPFESQLDGVGPKTGLSFRSGTLDTNGFIIKKIDRYCRHFFASVERPNSDTWLDVLDKVSVVQAFSVRWGRRVDLD